MSYLQLVINVIPRNIWSLFISLLCANSCVWKVNCVHNSQVSMIAHVNPTLWLFCFVLVWYFLQDEQLSYNSNHNWSTSSRVQGVNDGCSILIGRWVACYFPHFSSLRSGKGIWPSRPFSKKKKNPTRLVRLVRLTLSSFFLVVSQNRHGQSRVSGALLGGSVPISTMSSLGPPCWAINELMRAEQLINFPNWNQSRCVLRNL